MTVSMLSVAPEPQGSGAAPCPEQATTAPARPGSRADRMAQPLAADVLRLLAEHHGVCVKPLAIRRIDKHTGETTILDVPCGARLASKCKPCAERNRRLRQQQIREGWHLTEEPTPAVEAPSADVKAAITLRCTFAFEREQAMRESAWDQVTELDRAIDQLDETLSTMRVRGSLAVPADVEKPRRTRSTKRRDDADELPRRPIEDRTVGTVYAGNAGQTYQPSTFLTITLGGHGAVHTGARTRRGRLAACECGTLHGQQDPLLGTPFDPETYDYRAAALDAVFFAAGLDRFWQNLRRAAGWKIQYAGTVELQKRLAPHAHYAMRGTLPRELVAQVAAATYHQVWWPHFDTPVYTTERPPVWDNDSGAYLDPKTRAPLKTWAQALDELEAAEEAQPAYVLRLGKVKADGITPGTKSADRSIKYITKYVTKDLVEQVSLRSDEQRAHFDRLHAELATLPCSPMCANWLLYGVQPDKAKKGLTPGACSGKVHQRATLGFTGRRVLVSRQWSGKTLADHRADQRDWIRTVLAGGLAESDEPTHGDGDRYAFELARPDAPDVPPLQIRIMQSIAVRHRWKTALRNALGPPGAVPATQDRHTTLALAA